MLDIHYLIANPVAGSGRVARLLPRVLARLRDRGVPDCFSVCLGAVVRQVDAGDGAEPVQAVGELGFSEPGSEKTGGLGALSGRDDCEHVPTFANSEGVAGVIRNEFITGDFVGILQRERRVEPCSAAGHCEFRIIRAGVRASGQAAAHSLRGDPAPSSR